MSSQRISAKSTPVDVAARLMRERYGVRAERICRDREDRAQYEATGFFWGRVGDYLYNERAKATAVPAAPKAVNTDDTWFLETLSTEDLLLSAAFQDDAAHVLANRLGANITELAGCPIVPRETRDRIRERENMLQGLLSTIDAVREHGGPEVTVPLARQAGKARTALVWLRARLEEQSAMDHWAPDDA